MATLTLKNVPESLHHALKRAAADEGRSMNSCALSILEEAIAERERIRRMLASAEELERFVATLPPSANATDLIREDRDRR